MSDQRFAIVERTAEQEGWICVDKTQGLWRNIKTQELRRFEGEPKFYRQVPAV